MIVGVVLQFKFKLHYVIKIYDFLMLFHCHDVFNNVVNKAIVTTKKIR